MKSITRNIAIAALSATPALSQVLPSEIFGLSFSPQCQAAVIGAFTTGGLGQCFPVADLLPLLTSVTGGSSPTMNATSPSGTGPQVPPAGINATSPATAPITGSSTDSSIVPVLDNFMSDLCYNYPPCSNATLANATQTIIAGCSADLANGSLPNSVVETAFALYPTIREVLCLKTSDPYTAESYGGFLGEPAIPITSPPYNATGGTFCVTSLLTQLSAYYGTNLTVPFLGGIITGQNTTALDLTKSIQPNIICNECLFGALEVVDVAYPVVGETPVQAITTVLGVDGSALGNTTIDQLFDATCAYEGLSVNGNGTLPANISVSIINSTFPYTLTNGMTSFSPVAMAKRSLFGRKVRE